MRSSRFQMGQLASITRADALYCERVVRSHARAFTLASYFLPPRKRRASFAFFCFAKSASELAQPSGTDRKAIARKLLTRRRELAEALDGRPRGAILREVRWAVREFDLDPELLFDLVDGIGHNAALSSCRTWDELENSCERIAGTVATMCAQVLGIPGGAMQRQIALSHARTLGVAMQLTTILRDSALHARQGRCLLPDEELSRFSLRRDDIIGNAALTQDPRWRRLIMFEIGRARSFYERSLPGISMIAADSQRCAAACVIGYAAVLDVLEQTVADSLSARATLGTMARLGILWEAWRFRSRRLA